MIRLTEVCFSAIVSLMTKDKNTGISKDSTVAILGKGHSFGVRRILLLFIHGTEWGQLHRFLTENIQVMYIYRFVFASSGLHFKNFSRNLRYCTIQPELLLWSASLMSRYLLLVGRLVIIIIIILIYSFPSATTTTCVHVEIEKSIAVDGSTRFHYLMHIDV